MTVYKEFNIGGRGASPFGGFGGMVALILFFVMLYFLAKGLFYVLSFVAPILFLATLFIDHNVVINYGKFLLKLLKENPIMGVIAVIMTVVAFPIVSGFLFFKALAKRAVNSKLEAMGMGQEKEKFAEYQEVEIDEDEDIEYLELPAYDKTVVKPKPSTESESNDYEQLFD